MTAHALVLHRTHVWGPYGEWYALCKGCPSWQGRAELSRPEAIRHHTIHAMDAVGILL